TLGLGSLLAFICNANPQNLAVLRRLRPQINADERRSVRSIGVNLRPFFGCGCAALSLPAANDYSRPRHPDCCEELYCGCKPSSLAARMKSLSVRPSIL